MSSYADEPIVAPPRVAARPQLAVVTWSVIAICLAVWLAELMIPAFWQAVVLSPALGRLEPWRFLTSAFAHAYNPSHIAFNMLALYSVGRPLEFALGRARFTALYLLCALGGGVGFVLLASPPTPMNPLGSNWYTGVVGASGAVFGLFGAMVWLVRRAGGQIRQMAGLLALNAALPFFFSGIAWQAHLGGFVVGLLAGAVLTTTAERSRRRGTRASWVGFGVLTAVLVALLVARYLLA